jgi:hypothetical protein
MIRFGPHSIWSYTGEFRDSNPGAELNSRWALLRQTEHCEQWTTGHPQTPPSPPPPTCLRQFSACKKKGQHSTKGCAFQPTPTCPPHPPPTQAEGWGRWGEVEGKKVTRHTTSILHISHIHHPSQPANHNQNSVLANPPPPPHSTPVVRSYMRRWN